MRDGEEDGDAESVRDAFSLLAHDIRLDIVLALLDNWAAVYTEPQSYSELMDAVGMEDSGKFNYHLDKLRGVYVEEVEEGYVPTASATALYRAVLAHRPTETVSRTRELDDPCPHCGGTLTERYERSFFTLDCADCDSWSGMTYSFPKNGLRDRTDSDRYRAVQNRAGYHIGLARTGQCPFCAGRVTFDLDSDVEEIDTPGVRMACTTCTWHVEIDVLVPLRFAPEVAAALGRIGVEESLTKADGVEAVTASVRSEEPYRLGIDVEAADGTATVVVDGDLDVQSVSVTVGK